MTEVQAKSQGASNSTTSTSPPTSAAPSAEQQRAFLFHCMMAKDPCPDTQRNCILACDFGSITLCTDPRVGSAIGRVSYA